MVDRLVRDGLLVESEPTAMGLEGYAFVVRHRDVAFPSYPTEWSPAMFRDATLAYLRLVEQLLPLGLTLKDVHPWNLVFDFARPLYVDLTSLVPLEHGLPSPEKIARYYLRPLLLMERGAERIARCLLLEYDAVQERDLELVLGDEAMRRQRSRRRVGSRLPSVLRSVRRRASALERRWPAEWRKIVEAIRLPDESDTRSYSHDPRVSEPLARLVSELVPGSVLLLGDGHAHIGSLASSAGNRVVVFDPDSRAVTSLYRRARETGERILPLAIDFSRPTPSIGFSGHYSIAACDRLHCELVVASRQLIDYLVRRRSLRPDQLATGFVAFSTRWLAVELEDDEAAFHEALRPFFQMRKRFPVAAGRTLVLCEKRRPA